MSEVSEEAPTTRPFWKDVLLVFGFLGAYLALQIWILPAAGIPT